MRRWTVSVVAALIAAGSVMAGVALTGVAAAPVSTDPSTAAAAGAHYLATQIGADGTIAGPSGPDYDATVQSALALSAAGVETAKRDTTVAFLGTHVNAYVQRSGVDLPGRLARLILLAKLTGADPTTFGATDLLARLHATQLSTGPDTGRYGEANVLAGAFIQGLSLTALKAAGVTDAAGAAWLTSQQCADGPWAGYRADLTVTCAATTTSRPDSNGTAMAIMGLVAQGVTPAHDGLAYLRAAQTSTGWRFNATSTIADPNSTALAVQAVIASGADPRGAAYTIGGVSAMSALLGFQLGCDRPAADRGAFWYDFGQDDDRITANLLATAQAVPAAAGQTFPFTPAPFTGPADSCAAPGPTTTTSTTSTSTSTTSIPMSSIPTTSTTTAATTTIPAMAVAPTTTMARTTTTIGVEIGDAISVTRPVDTTGVLGNSTSRTSNGLVVTGTNALVLVVLGFCLVGAGSIILLARRRRSR